MAGLTLQFVRRPLVPWAGLGFLLIAAIIGVNCLDTWLDLSAARTRHEQRLVALELATKVRQEELKKRIQSVGGEQVSRIKDERAVLSALRYPWNLVLATVEQGGDDGVALLSMTHDKSAGTQLTVEAVDAQSLFRFVDKMNADRGAETPVWYLASQVAEPQHSPPMIRGLILGK